MQNLENETRSHMKLQQTNEMPFCVRRYWWLAVFAVVGIICLGVITFDLFKGTNDDKNKKETIPLVEGTELANMAENAHLTENKPNDSQPTKPFLAQRVVSKQSEEQTKQQISALKSAQVAEMPALLRSAYQSLSSNLNKIVTDSYGNKYTIKNIYLRDFKEYT